MGNVTSTSVEGLVECQPSYLAVAAYNGAGESELSGHIEPWPRPVLLSATPGAVEQGSSVEWIVSGLNFREGDAIGFSHPGITVTGISVEGCQMLRINATIAEDASPGAEAKEFPELEPVGLEVTSVHDHRKIDVEVSELHPDRTRSDNQ